jgi:adenylate cyclase
VRIGFQAGPIIERDDDVFGDTVNLASRLVKQAVKAQILTSEETAAQLTGP